MFSFSVMRTNNESVFEISFQFAVIKQRFFKQEEFFQLLHVCNNNKDDFFAYLVLAAYSKKYRESSNYDSNSVS